MKNLINFFNKRQKYSTGIYEGNYSWFAFKISIKLQAFQFLVNFEITDVAGWEISDNVFYFLKTKLYIYTVPCRNGDK